MKEAEKIIKDPAERERLLLEIIETGARFNLQLEVAYREHPAPELERLLEISRSLALHLQMRSPEDPSLLRLVSSVQESLLKQAGERKKLELSERRVKMLEEKAAKADAAEQVAKASMSDEAKMARYREIFGMAASPSVRAASPAAEPAQNP